MKYVAVSAQNGQCSGLKDTVKEVEDWARAQLSNTKATCIYLCEAVSTLTVAPREIISTPIVKPISNGHDNDTFEGEPISPLHHGCL